MTSLAQRLVRDEMFDLALYQALLRFAKGDLARTLALFIATEIRHVRFWRQFFDVGEVQLGIARTCQLWFLVGVARVGGQSVIALMLEAIEVHGVKKYLTLWQEAKDEDFRLAIRKILEEELLHEDEAITSSDKRKISAATVRNVFLGFNDGSVEILGAVNGLAAAFGNPAFVGAAGLTVSVAGALSMAAGAYLSADSEKEILETEAGKQAFLRSETPAVSGDIAPMRSAFIVGASYIIGAAVPVAPFLLGAHAPWWSIVLSGALILAVSSILAFLSGMHIARRVALNGALLTVTVLVAYGIGEFVERMLL